MLLCYVSSRSIRLACDQFTGGLETSAAVPVVVEHETVSAPEELSILKNKYTLCAVTCSKIIC